MHSIGVFDCAVLLDDILDNILVPNIRILVNRRTATHTRVSIGMRFKILRITVIPHFERCGIVIVRFECLRHFACRHIEFCLRKPLFEKFGVGRHVNGKINRIISVFKLNLCVVGNNFSAEVHVVYLMDRSAQNVNCLVEFVLGQRFVKQRDVVGNYERRIRERVDVAIAFVLCTHVVEIIIVTVAVRVRNLHKTCSCVQNRF